MGNCLVISCIKTVGKETARCIRYELTPRRFVFFLFMEECFSVNSLLYFCLGGIMLRSHIFILAGRRVKSSVSWMAKWLNPLTYHGINILCFLFHTIAICLPSLSWLIVGCLFLYRFVSTTEHFDKCSIGCGPDGEEPFCGQVAALYVFSEALSSQQANAIFCLGPSYQSRFLHEAETDLSDDHKKVMH